MRPLTARVTLFGLGVATLVVTLAASAEAGSVVAGVPEIDGSAVPAVLGILTSGVLLLRAARRGSK